MSPPLSAPSVTVVNPVMNEANDLPRLFDRMTDGLRVLGVVLSGPFRCLGAPPVDTHPRYVVPPACALPSDAIHVRPTQFDSLAMRGHVAVESPAMRPRAPLDLIHSTSNAARVITRARISELTTPVGGYSVREEPSRTLRMSPQRKRRLAKQVEADDQRNGVGPSKRICIVGSGWRFLSGISYYTCRMSNSLAETDYEVSAILMRRLLPRRLYPGKARVGSRLADLRYDDRVRVLDGVDYFWWPSLLRAFRFLWRERPDVVVFEWWSATVLHTYLVLAYFARLLGARVVVEFHETLDSAEATMLFPRLYADVFIRPMLWIASGFAVHSDFDRDVIERRYPVGTKPVAVVPHGPYDHGVRASERRPRAPMTRYDCSSLGQSAPTRDLSISSKPSKVLPTLKPSAFHSPLRAKPGRVGTYPRS